MKIPGLYQACDAFTSVSCYMQPKGALIYYIASDFTPSSTQHVIDPRYLFKSCFVPVFEPRTHQEMHEAAGLAADISRTHRTPVVILAGGLLCHSEGLVKLAEQHTRPLAEVGPLALQHALPGMARISYDTVMAERMPGLVRMSRNRLSTSTIRERDGAGSSPAARPPCSCVNTRNASIPISTSFQ